MDIQHLVDRLEDLIDDGRHLFGTKYTMIDEERALEIIDQMRISIPEEIEKSARILAQRDRVLAEAHEEAARIIQQHRSRAEQMLDNDATVQAARARAEAIKEQARQEAARITAEADQYVMQMLSRLEERLSHNLSEVRNGLQLLQQQQQQQIASSQYEGEVEAEEPAQAVHLPQPVEREAVDITADQTRDHEPKNG